MKKSYRILSTMLASILAVSSPVSSMMLMNVNATENGIVSENENVSEPTVAFNSELAFDGAEMKVTVSNVDDYSLVWSIDGTEVSTEDTYTITTNDLEKFLKVDVISNGSIVASNSIYCSNLPVVYIGCDDIDTLNGSWTHEDYYGATMKIQGNSTYNNAKQLYDGDIQIKGRGTSTWGFAKKPYKIKLDSKSNLFGMGKNKHWVLLANYADGTLMRNYTAYSLAKGLGQVAMDSVFVDVIINGEYVGNYQLCEQIRVSDDRVDIYDYEGKAEDAADEICATYGIDDKDTISSMEDAMKENLSWMTTGTFEFNGTVYNVSEIYSDWSKLQKKISTVDGYLLELATDANGETSYFYTSKNVGIDCAYPEYLKTNDTMMSNVQNTIQTFENALYSNDGNTTIDGELIPYNELCNMNSLYGYWTTGMVFMNEIGHRSNYMYLDKGILNFGPVWDFDWSAGCEISGWPSLDYNKWFGQGDWAGTWFYQVGKNNYFAIKEQEYYWNNHELIESYLDGNRSDSLVTKLYNELYASGMANSEKWASTSSTLNGYEADYQQMITWLDNRLNWIDEQFATEDSAVKSLGGTVSSNLNVSIQNADGTPLETDDISIITGDGKVPVNKDIQVTAKVDNLWEASYMALYINNKYVDTVKNDNNTVIFDVPASYLTSDVGTKNVIQIYGVSSPGSSYYQCTNFATVVQYETTDTPEITTPVTTTTSEPTITTVTTTTPEPTTTTVTTTTPEPTTTTVTTTTPEPTTTTVTTTTPEPT
ncbi:MAG: CotH kinase family protein, partial [Oscillospiraceae bacterium]